MAKSANQKLKLLVLLRFLQRQSDEKHPVTMAEMIAELARWDISAERKSLYDDLETLRSFGADVVALRGRTPGYYLGSREFELPELKLLVDSIQSSKFITQRKTLSLIRKLEGRFVACGTPWCGKEGMGTNAIRPLTAFGILNRGEKNEIRPAAREELLPMMLRQTYRPKDAARLVKQLGLMDACFRALPVYTLYCNMDPSAARMAWETMGRHLSE